MKYANGSVVSFPETCFYEIDAQAVVTGEGLATLFIAVASDHTVKSGTSHTLMHVVLISFASLELAPSC